jgi:uncharacterized protein YbjT (DUF2867 family)
LHAGFPGRGVHLSPALIQPISSDDVADAMVGIALGTPLNGTIEIAGPDRVRLSDLVGQFLRATNDSRKGVVDVHAPYFGIDLDDRSLVPGGQSAHRRDPLQRQRRPAPRPRLNHGSRLHSGAVGTRRFGDRRARVMGNR